MSSSRSVQSRRSRSRTRENGEILGFSERKLTLDLRLMRYIRLHIWLYSTINKPHGSSMVSSLHSAPTSAHANDTVTPIHPRRQHHVIQTIHQISPHSSNPPHHPRRSNPHPREIRYTCSGHWLVLKLPKLPTKRWQLPPRLRRLILVSRPVLPRGGLVSE